MALSLTAEQKKLLQILKIDEQYIIPEYQRPYSWEYDHCLQLYSDLIEVYKTNKNDDSNEDYFIGNIIIAKSESNEYELDVVDGQQRLTTLFLMVKVLSLFTEHKVYKSDLEKIIGSISRTTSEYEFRIKTTVFESDDATDLKKVLEYEKTDFENRLNECINQKQEIEEKRCSNRFEKNIMFFYNWFKYLYEKEGSLDGFIKFFLEKVYLLPIELRGKTRDDANEKALVIFETINDRGKDLEDADIFKAKLYKRARKVQEEKIFIDLWKDFKSNCESLKIDIDDIFRYYTHIIRGERGITSSEINLREFFTTKDYSPFNLKKYKDVMNDLFEIISILEYINQEKQQATKLAKWLQLIEAYTNQYPKNALVVYMYVNRDRKEEDISKFLEKIIRYSYYHGSTTRIKTKIYNIIKQISSKEEISDYFQKNITSEYFDYLGNLKKGYALLSEYTDRETAFSKHYIDKLISLKDNKILQWEEEQIEDFINSLGNFIVSEMPKKNMSIEKKLKYYSLNISLDYDDFMKRDKEMKEKLVKFFKGNIDE
jgi:uncharacterized protein with ParB-like and HNH nuclease domain